MVKHELQNKHFNILSSSIQLMDDSDSNSRININLTGDGQSVAEFVVLSKDLELVNLCCSSSSDSSFCSSDSSIDSFPSNLMPCGLLQDQSDSDISTSRTSLCSSRTGRRAGLPHLRLIGTLIKFCCQGQEEEPQGLLGSEH